MRIIADFHIHSKYSRATSRNISLDALSLWAGIKGINLLGTGDFTHPIWIEEIKNNLREDGSGFLVHKDYKNLKYILTTEISNIYSQGGKVRKVHNLIFAPSIKTVENINKELSKIGNIAYDGRPILGLSSRDLAKLVLDIDPNCMVIPAHAWTPWFSVFGSKSGFDSLEECFLDMTPNIYAIETGLSSDPEMNCRVSMLDPITLISCSDAHSAKNLAREATVFEVKNEKDFTYKNIYEAIKHSRDLVVKSGASKIDTRYLKNKNYSIDTRTSRLVSTIEFYPEEGMYHFDGHRACGNISMHPDESEKINNICEVCNKELTIGVLNRVNKLADRPEGYFNQNFPASRHLVPLAEIIAEIEGVGKQSKKVEKEYFETLKNGSEIDILLYKTENELLKNIEPSIARNILKMREGRVKKTPGFDGVYGSVKIN